VVVVELMWLLSFDARPVHDWIDWLPDFLKAGPSLAAAGRRRSGSFPDEVGWARSGARLAGSRERL